MRKGLAVAKAILGPFLRIGLGRSSARATNAGSCGCGLVAASAIGRVFSPVASGRPCRLRRCRCFLLRFAAGMIGARRRSEFRGGSVTVLRPPQPPAGPARTWSGACACACAPVPRSHLSLRDALFLRIAGRTGIRRGHARRFSPSALAFAGTGRCLPLVAACCRRPGNGRLVRRCRGLSLCLSIAPRGTITAQGALLIFVGQTLPAQSAFAKFFLRHARTPRFRRHPMNRNLRGQGTFFPKIYCIRRSFVYKPASPAGRHDRSRSFGE